MLPISIFGSIIKDYFVICDSYYNAVKLTLPSRIEAIDMGRRGLHNEGSEILRERVKPFAEIDLDTAHRLFTLICVPHRRLSVMAETPSAVLFACTYNTV